jgi:FixJ family two-component response regulator
MPWIDGPLLARWLAMDDPGFAVPFISGEGDVSELGEFKDCGFLAKPFSPSTLLTEVNRRLRLDAAPLLS